MALWIDRKYCNLVAYKLDRFAWKGNNTANCRCPYCGDSKKNTYKARGYIYELKGSLMYKCHNCGIALPIGALIKHLDPKLYKDWRLEKFKSGSLSPSEKAPKEEVKELSEKTFSERDLGKLAERISELDPKHYARAYLAGRKLPKEWFDKLYYTRDFKKLVDALIPGHEKKLKENDPRIVIPFYVPYKDKWGHSSDYLVAIQGRALEADAKTRYITIKTDDDYPKIFGLDRFDASKPGFILEGPFDAMFLENAIATSGASLNDIRQYIDAENTVYVLDNDRRNKDIVAIMKKIIEAGYKIFIWPDHIDEKDINDLVKAGWTVPEITHLIHSRSFHGLKASLELNKWKKC